MNTWRRSHSETADYDVEGAHPLNRNSDRQWGSHTSLICSNCERVAKQIRSISKEKQ